RDALFEKARREALAVDPGKCRFQLRAQRLAVDEAVGIAAEARVLEQVGSADLGAEAGELPVVANPEEDPLRPGPELVVGADIGVRVASALRRLTGEKEIRHVRVEESDGAVVERR